LSDSAHPGPDAPRDLIVVSSGLELDGGGRAVAGRLLAASCAAFARERGVGLQLLSLAGLDGFETDVRARGFGGHQRALALDLWRRQMAARKVACVYDLLGPARAQAWLPGPLRTPYLVAIYGVEVWSPLPRARYRALARASIRLSPSQFTLDEARRANGDFGSVEVVPLCLEERPPAGEIDHALLERAGTGYLLIVGRIVSTERYKGHDELLAAFPQLLTMAPGARLVVAGEGDDRDRLQARAAAMGLSGQVLFTGFVSEATLVELYRRAAVFVMPSRGEGFGLVYLEAMRAAKPCVAARGTVASEVIADGETGLLVDGSDGAALAATLARLLCAPEAAADMGQAGRRRFDQVFTPRRFRERLWPLLERLTA
jgi:phosphatidylinositol alpha-1,6-mannosyltransferase